MLTANQQWALKRLQKRQHQWRWFRWVGLALSVGVVVAGVYLELTSSKALLELTSGPGFDKPATGFAVFIASGYSKVLALAELFRAVGIGLIAFVLAAWRGRPVDILLLKAFEQEIPTAEQWRR